MKGWKFAESQTVRMTKEIKIFMKTNQMWAKGTYLFCKMTVICYPQSCQNKGILWVCHTPLSKHG